MRCARAPAAWNTPNARTFLFVLFDLPIIKSVSVDVANRIAASRICVDDAPAAVFFFLFIELRCVRAATVTRARFGLLIRQEHLRAHRVESLPFGPN